MSDAGLISNLELGAVIRRRRRELDLSQDELAQRLNVSYQQVQRYETGKNILNVEGLQLLARALSVPVAYFFTSMPAGGVAATVMICGSAEEAELLALYRRIKSEERQELVMDFARLAAGETPPGNRVERLVDPEPLWPRPMAARTADEEKLYLRRLSSAPGLL